jgi:pyruvate kinase
MRLKKRFPYVTWGGADIGLDLLVTLWPSFPHFERFAVDHRLAGIRLNSAMMSDPELNGELAKISSSRVEVPLFFDVKSRQPRVVEVIPNDDYLDIRLNHPISVETPVVVLFKAEADYGLLGALSEGGRRLTFAANPRYKVRAGESLHIRHPSFRILTPDSIFTKSERIKIERVRKAGFKRYFLSYVEEESDIDQFLELVGRDAEVWLKIETQRGLRYVAQKFKKRDNLVLVAARGDLYVEIERPHGIMAALKLIVDKDPAACVASRMLLSVIPSPLRDPERNVRAPEVPSCADLLELAWLRDIGYRRMMLCDELCLHEKLLASAMSAFDSFRAEYR